jgi:nucleotide-binding universal stress UspA family protein
MPFSTIVVGMDFSESAVNAAKWTVSSVAPHAAVTLVHVIDPPDRPRFARDSLPSAEAIEATAREFAETQLRQISALLAPIMARTEIRVGKPHEEIARVARDLGADLIAVGPHGDRPGRTKFLGTTADRLVRTSPIPVLVATNPPLGKPTNILVPVDDAPITPALLSAVRSIAEAWDATVTLLHIWSNAVYSHVASMAHITSTNETDAQRAIDEDLRNAGRAWLEEAARVGLARDVSIIVTHGSPGDVTVTLAAERHIDLIAMGRRGAGEVAAALLGSTVGTVLHAARCPVLVITDRSDTDERS